MPPEGQNIRAGSDSRFLLDDATLRPKGRYLATSTATAAVGGLLEDTATLRLGMHLPD